MVILLRIAGWLSPILGVLIGVLIFTGIAKPPATRVTGITAVVLGVIYFIVFHSIADSIRAFLSIEENSKKIATLLEEKKNTT
ncbi:MAG: hypothetical protein FJZ16_01740 [Candidatus Omnitrophica bacterium]|nr:hypothetical protein [Candidatus Omnitrophota bacterium]